MDYRDKPAAAKWSLFTPPLTELLAQTIGGIYGGQRREGLSLDVDGIGWVQHRSDIILRKDANLHCQV